MNASGTRGCDTHTEPVSELGVTAGHESSSFFMPHLDETNLVLRLAKSLHDAVNAIARKSENRIDIPIDECVHNHFCRSLRHTVKTATGIKCNGEMTVNIRR